jgi:hypothetical protein
VRGAKCKPDVKAYGSNKRIYLRALATAYACMTEELTRSPYRALYKKIAPSDGFRSDGFPHAVLR